MAELILRAAPVKRTCQLVGTPAPEFSFGPKPTAARLLRPWHRQSDVQKEYSALCWLGSQEGVLVKEAGHWDGRLVFSLVDLQPQQFCFVSSPHAWRWGLAEYQLEH